MVWWCGVVVWCWGCVVVVWCCGVVVVWCCGVVLGLCGGVVVLWWCGGVLGWLGWAQGVAQLEALKAIATLCLLAGNTQDTVNQFGILCVAPFFARLLPALVCPKTKKLRNEALQAIATFGLLADNIKD